jgi:hypothetical protein
MEFIFWLAGYLFTVGYEQPAEKRDFWHQTAIALFCLLMWPFVLGVLLSGKKEEE